MIEPGIYTDLTSDQYHGDKASISRSALMDFKKSPREYWARHLNPDKPLEESKPSWVFGTAFHTLILEPHLFEQNYFVLPEKVLLKNVGRVAYDTYKFLEEEAERTDKIILSHADYQKLCAMRESLMLNARARELVAGAIYESSYFWEDESGLMVKSRPDILHSNLYVDLKTIDSADPHTFQKAMAQHGYHIQAAMVVDGVQALTGKTLSACINLCVEKTYPYSVGIYIIDESAIEIGRKEYKQLALDLFASVRDNNFPDFEPETITLPKYYNYESN